MNPYGGTVDEYSFLITEGQASHRYAISRGAVAELAKRAGAFVKIERRARINVKIMDEFIYNNYTVVTTVNSDKGDTQNTVNSDRKYKKRVRHSVKMPGKETNEGSDTDKLC